MPRATPTPPPQDAALAAALSVALLPHFGAALHATALATDAAAVLQSLKAFDTSVPVSARATGQGAPPPPPPRGAVVATVRREIPSKSYLRRMHVNSELSDLLPDMSAHVPDDQNMRNHANKTFFKKPLALLDSRLTPHTVTYDSLVSSGQRHTRLSAGWSGLMRHLGAAQGDTVVLELRGPRAAGMLHVRLESGGQ